MDVPREKNAAGDEGTDGGAKWIWTAVDAKTRLILGFLVGQRDQERGRAMIEGVVGRLSEQKSLFTSDELAHYATLLAEAYHEKVPVSRTGKPGRSKAPEKVIHEDLDYATVHKTRKDERVVRVARNIVFGNPERLGNAWKLPRAGP